MRDGFRQLVRLSTALEAGMPLPRDVIDWLTDGVQRYRAREARTLDEALCLGFESGGYFKHPLLASRYAVRDDLIRLQAASLPGYDTERAERIAEALARGPDHCEWVDRVFSVGVNVPTSSRQILRILRFTDT